MGGRRSFLKSAGACATASILFPSIFEDVASAAAPDPASPIGLRFTSDSISAELSKDAPEFIALSIDGLGKGRHGANIVEAKSSTSGFKASSFTSGELLRVDYRSNAVD